MNVVKCNIDSCSKETSYFHDIIDMYRIDYYI